MSPNPNERVARRRAWLVPLLCAAAVAACNEGRGSSENEPDIASTDASADTGGDATSVDTDEPDFISVDIGLDAPADTAPEDAEVDAEPDVISVEVGTTDVPPDTIEPPTDAPLVVFAVEEDGQQVLRVVPADASREPYTVARFDGVDLERPAFSPSGDEIAFLFRGDGDAGLGIVSLVEDRPPLMLRNLTLIELYRVEWSSDDLLYVTALGPAGQIEDAVVTVFALPLSEPSGPYNVAYPGPNAQIRAAYVPSDVGFGHYYHQITVPPHGDLWYDAQGGRVPIQATSGMPIAADVTALSEDRLLFTDANQRVHVGTLARGELSERFEPVTAAGVQDFHPRPLLTGTHFVSARYPEEVSSRPTPRDLVLVSMDTGELVTRITNTPELDEHDPDVQWSETWRR